MTTAPVPTPTRWRYGSENVSGNLHDAARWVSVHHPDWDVVAMQCLSGHNSIIVYREVIPPPTENRPPAVEILAAGGDHMSTQTPEQIAAHFDRLAKDNHDRAAMESLHGSITADAVADAFTAAARYVREHASSQSSVGEAGETLAEALKWPTAQLRHLYQLLKDHHVTVEQAVDYLPPVIERLEIAAEDYRRAP